MMTRLDFDRLWVAPVHPLRLSLLHRVMNFECGCREATESPEHLYPTIYHRVYLVY